MLSRQAVGRVLVIGAQGVLGTIVADRFTSAGWHTLRAGRRPDSGSNFIHVDLANPDTLATTFTGVDLVVNTVPDLHLVAERTVIDCGGTLINVSALPATFSRQLQAETKSSTGTVLMNAGVAPGLTNLIASDLIESHPEADEIELVFTVSTRSSIGPAGAEFAHRGVTATARHRTTVITLPAPFGRRRCLGFAEQDAGWLADTLIVDRTVSPYLCIAEPDQHENLLSLNYAGVIGGVPRAAFAATRQAVSDEPVAHWVAVRRQGVLLGARTLRCNGEYRAAAISTVVFGRALLARAAPVPRGVVTPEQLFTMRELGAALQAEGITVAVEYPHMTTENSP